MRLIGTLEKLITVLAAASLIYGTFREPLEPYMYSVFGGALHLYRELRDLVFDHFLFGLTWLLNYASNFIARVPPIPQITLPPIAKDIIAMFGIMFAGYSNGALWPWTTEIRSGVQSNVREIKRDKRVSKEDKKSAEEAERFFLFWYILNGTFLNLIGGVLFFILAYAETRILS